MTKDNRSNKNSLKGWNNLAQGKRRRSVALGWRNDFKFVRAKRFVYKLTVIRTKWRVSNFPINNLLYSVRYIAFILNNLVSRTVKSFFFFSLGDISDRSSRNFAQGYNILAFQAEKVD